MYELKKNGKVFTSKSVGTGPSAYEKRIYWAAVSHRLRNTGLLLLGYKPVQHVTVLNTAGNCNTMVSVIIKRKVIPLQARCGPECG